MRVRRRRRLEDAGAHAVARRPETSRNGIIATGRPAAMRRSANAGMYAQCPLPRATGSYCTTASGGVAPLQPFERLPLGRRNDQRPREIRTRVAIGDVLRVVDVDRHGGDRRHDRQRHGDARAAVAQDAHLPRRRQRRCADRPRRRSAAGARSPADPDAAHVGHVGQEIEGQRR